ncbi:MAG: hypothetical protein J6386_23465 [Candidatus Synoicihabitans palmerolidicus]|nr:hypothetical protein [Candidatus Synoicihabitans palmerolidicus]
MADLLELSLRFFTVAEADDRVEHLEAGDIEAFEDLVFHETGFRWRERRKSRRRVPMPGHPPQ